jgi:hypothetical protein
VDKRQYLARTEEKAKDINRTLETTVWPRDNKIAGLSGSEIQSVVTVVREATLAGDCSPKDRQPTEPLLVSIHTSKNIEPTSRQIRVKDLINMACCFASDPIPVATCSQLVMKMINSY